MNHKCYTVDGFEIRLGDIVRDYDGNIGVVVEAPRDYDLADVVCWPSVGHYGHWWSVCPDREGHVHEIGTCRGGIFDGSRLWAWGFEPGVGFRRTRTRCEVCRTSGEALEGTETAQRGEGIGERMTTKTKNKNDRLQPATRQEIERVMATVNGRRLKFIRKVK